MSTVLQGKYENGEAHVAVKGSAKETAVLLAALIQKLAQGLNMSYEDTVRYINSSRRRNGDDIFERDDDSEEYSSRDELAKFFRRETNPVREHNEPVQKERRQKPVRQAVETSYETYEEPVSVQRKVPKKQIVIPSPDPIESIFLRNGIDSIYLRKVTYAMPDMDWFDCRKFEMPSGVYYTIIENRAAKDAKSRISICKTTKYDDGWVLANGNRPLPETCRAVACCRV